MPDQRLTLILSIFCLNRATAPEAAILERIVDEVRRAEALEGGERADDTQQFLRRRTALCDAAVQRFIKASIRPPSQA